MLPHTSAARQRIENRVELADILPTLLQEVQVEIPKEVQGESLLALIKDEDGRGSGGKQPDG
jgi:bisphosphoglycerate-independent phosphoglycerate mutase (AlkP superfamily)